ncbi:colicin I receptor precursor [bacterium BMS3Bbin06]|nr:colicin I receptor precursor [bacterium BMS3Abin08]GBE34610.1 colicin I receptor precursor [bacterium BMS3Bbin06]HDO34671.1 TonB-dependent receptor [Nitrospirota bacterium]HDY70507.1 TonB-dependent receptor [Nitrospirota bacterium]
MRKPSKCPAFLNLFCIPANLLVAFIMLFPVPAAGNDKGGVVAELMDMSIEELMNISVTSVSKKPEKLYDASSAVYVITREEIRRSGATSIAEALRGVPGLEVNRIDSNLWAISARGFNERYANKLLVMIDGRSVYSPIFSGVYWDVQDVMLEDIDRIEVIRGPGATMWGANAVNGIINVITRSAEDTQGGLVSLLAGTEERNISAFRYGGKIGEDLFYRVYTKYARRDGFVDLHGGENSDGWYVLRSGFRMDWVASAKDKITFQGDIYGGNVDSMEILPLLTPPYSLNSGIDEDISGGNLLGRWSRSFSSDSDLVIQLYYDHVKRFQKFDVEGMHEIYAIDTLDFDMSHNFKMGKRHSITWGAGIRCIRDELRSNSPVRFDPEKRDLYLYNAFIQDEMDIIKDRLSVTVGTKIEHNDYTGFEFQPNIRMKWIPGGRSILWAAVSRAVRIPSRIEMNGRIDQVVVPDSMPTMFSLIAGDDYESEELIAYEAGYRFRPDERISLDLAVFFNDFDNLRTFEPGPVFLETSPAPAHIVVSLNGRNKMRGETYGAEVAAKWQVTGWWRLILNYTYLQMQLHRDEDSLDPQAETAEGENPHNRFSLFSMMDIGRGVQLDLNLHYVDSLPTYGIKSYVVSNIRIGWSPSENVGFSIVGQNLLDRYHPEISSKYVSSGTVQVERGVYGKFTVKF